MTLEIFKKFWLWRMSGKYASFEIRYLPFYIWEGSHKINYNSLFTSCLQTDNFTPSWWEQFWAELTTSITDMFLCFFENSQLHSAIYRKFMKLVLFRAVRFPIAWQKHVQKFWNWTLSSKSYRLGMFLAFLYNGLQSYLSTFIPFLATEIK